MVKRLAWGLLLLVVAYLAMGTAFHLRWEQAQAACRAQRLARGEWVEPEVFRGPLAWFFDATYWPVYGLANLRRDGTLWATPCTRAQGQSFPARPGEAWVLFQRQG